MSDITILILGLVATFGLLVVIAYLNSLLDIVVSKRHHIYGDPDPIEGFVRKRYSVYLTRRGRHDMAAWIVDKRPTIISFEQFVDERKLLTGRDHKDSEIKKQQSELI